MAQIYIPDDPRVREQLQRGGTTPEKEQPPRQVRRRRFGIIDLLVFLAVVAAATLLVMAASRWAAPLTPNNPISLAPAVLPLYAAYSLLRMMLAYVLSLVFTLIYGHVAATNRHAERIMLPVLLIFTSQAWNMTFSFYHSARALPSDLKEVTAMSQLRPWRRFLVLEVPASMIGLIWNSMMSWAGGWFFLMASEQFTIGSKSFQLPGLGSYLQLAANNGDTGAILLGLFTLIALIVLLDLLFWRPLVAWADKFKLELSTEANAPHSPVLNALRRSTLVALVNRRVFHPIGHALARLLDRLQPLPDSSALALSSEQVSRALSLRRIAGWICVGILGVIALIGLVSALQLLIQVSLLTWGTLLLAAFATWLRTLAALLIGVAWTVPVGVAIGLSPRWSRRLQPVVQVVASIPATALFPVLLLLLVNLPGGLSLAAILLMLLGTQWYILFNVIAGAMAIPNDLREATTVYHVSGWRKWITLILPAIFPYLVTGLLTASGGAWNASIVSEYVQFNNHTASTFGLGASIAEAATSADFPRLLAATLLMSVFVVVINRLVWKRMYTLAERRYTLA